MSTLFWFVLVPIVMLLLWPKTKKQHSGSTSSTRAAAVVRVDKITWEMMDTGGQPITSAQAVKLFKEFMLKTGHLGKDELTEHAKYFSDAMKDHEQCLKEYISSDLNNLRDQLATLRLQKKVAWDVMTAETINDEIRSIQSDIKNAQKEAAQTREKLKAFKADKRQFLVNYVNQRIQNT